MIDADKIKENNKIDEADSILENKFKELYDIVNSMKEEQTKFINETIKNFNNKSENKESEPVEEKPEKNLDF